MFNKMKKLPVLIMGVFLIQINLNGDPQEMKIVAVPNNSKYLGKIELIGSSIEKRIVGKTWTKECPVPLSDLRYLTIPYWGYDNKEHIGEMIVHKDVANEVIDIFQELFDAKFPIERMQLIDDYFEAGRTNREIDRASMTQNNTSAFFFRFIGGTTIVSEHGFGTAIDINPKVNPFVQGDFVSPFESKEYADRTRKDVKGFLTEESICVKAFLKRGWIWAGKWKKAQDYQHFCKVQKELPQIILAQPPIFNQVWSHLAYFHAADASKELLLSVADQNLIFEIDLSWAHSSFNPYVKEGQPYIGHPEEFYTKMGKPFPSNNIDIAEFQTFLIKHPSIKVLIDIKDEMVYPFLRQFIQAVGPKRCIVHAFIKNWTHIPTNGTIEPHWYREDVDLFMLNDILAQLHVPLIANCRGFSDANVEQNHLVSQMIKDSKRCSSVISLGLYYPGVPLPNIQFLQVFHDAGYYAWVNGNIPHLEEKLGKIRHIAMTDCVKSCTQRYVP